MGSKLIKFEVCSFPGARVIGRSVRVREPTTAEDTSIEDLWAALERDGGLAALQALPRRLTPEADAVGWMGDWNPGEGAFTYLAGMLFEPGAAAPEGFIARDIAPGGMAVGWIQELAGEEGGELHAAASGHVGRARDERGYTYDGSRGMFEMEVYTQARFYRALERGEPVMLDFYTPCRQS